MASKTAVIAWGSGEDGQLGIGNNEEREWVCTIKALESENVRSVVAGSRNSLAICEDGKLFTWGWNQRGTLGHPPETKTENIPSQVKALANVKIVQAAIDGWHCLAVDDQGRAYAWGKMLEAKYNLYWTPCAAHCLDLMLEDIFKLPQMKSTFERAVSLSSYIYTRLGVVNMMREFTSGKELLRPAKTRFATAFITLQRIHEQKNNLRKMFSSEMWCGSKWAKEPMGKKSAEIIMMPSFWNNVVFGLKVAGPLVRVLRLVDGEKKPAMGYIYEAMDRAKETIVRSFDGNEAKYKEVFRIIDDRWDIQLHRPLHAAGHFLNPEYFYSNPNIEQQEEVMGGLYKCIEKLVPNPDAQDKIIEELTKYKRADGLFGIDMAIRQRTKRAPGGNEYGQCGEEPERKDDTGRPLKRDIVIPLRCASKLSVRQVAAGGTHSVVLTHEGHVWTWGQPWPPGDIKQISTPVRVQGLERVRVIAVGAFHNLALLQDGTLWAWGNNEYGQLGTGDTQPTPQPIPVQGLSGLTLVDIAAGGWHSTALTDEGEVYGWGRGEHGRLGFGDDKSSKMVPQRVQLLVGEDIVQVSCGGTHSVALTRDGRMFSFGRGDHGRLGYGRKATTGHPSEVPITLPPPRNLSGGEGEGGRWCAKLVACGGRHTLAIVEWLTDESQPLI